MRRRTRRECIWQYWMNRWAPLCTDCYLKDGLVGWAVDLAIAHGRISPAVPATAGVYSMALARCVEVKVMWDVEDNNRQMDWF